MKERLYMICFSIAEAVLGVLLLINPVGLTTWIIMALGLVLSVVGIINIIQYFRTPAQVASLKKSLAIGILTLLLGVWLMVKNKWFLAIFPVLTTLYGIAVLIEGVVKVQWTADALRLKNGRWGWIAVSACITIFCAVVILTNPFFSTAALWLFTGITLIVEAIVDIISTLLKKDRKDR